ncbi:Protein BAP28 [Giardia lamblia P15]|uniref:HEAT repeat-containing protein 1 n=1 Tax=Giardia intestinalis (strain P15) TaxID=658858 RepID=E1EXF5_GIAIA|nr:Protein BAP28 [Giardia lamblia P15]
MSSLQQQLSRLSSETIVFSSTGARKNVPSLLYGDNAKSISVETIHEIALAALTELQSIDPSFAAFRANIFHPSAPQYDREAHTEEHNLTFIDKPMSLFLNQVIPYLHLPAAHRAIEFLIRRFRADIKCVEQLVMAFLPYHETVIFSYLVTCLFSMNDPEKLPSSHILLLLGRDGWPGPRSVFLKQLRRNSYSLFAKLISKVIDLEKVSPESCLFYMRFCFAVTNDLLAFPSLGQDQVLLRETFRLISWALGPKAHSECRDAACLLLLRAPPILLHGLAESKQGRNVMKLFLLHPISGDRRKALKILLGLTHNALENNVPTVLTLTDMLYGLCQGDWALELKGSAFSDLVNTATKRKTDDKCRALLTSFTYIFSDSLFRFTVVPWKSTSVPDKDRPSLLAAFRDGLQSVTVALRAIVEGDKQKEKTLRVGLSKLIKHIAFLVAKYTLIDADSSSSLELQELAQLAADIDVSSFASGAMQSVEETSTEPREFGADVTNRVLTLLFGENKEEYWMLAPVAAPSGVPCILALDSSSTELRTMGYSQVQVLIEKFVNQKPVNINGLLKTLPLLCTRLLSEGNTKLLETLCGCISRLISALPQKLSVSLSSDELMTLLSETVFFYKRLISNGMLTDIYLSTLAQLRECLLCLTKEELSQECAYLGAHLELLRFPDASHRVLSIEELIFPFGSMARMLEAVMLSIKNASASKHSDIIIAHILQIDSAISEGSKEGAVFEAFISQVLASSGYSHLFVDVLCQHIASCSAFLLNTTIKHSTSPDVLARIGTAYVADKDLSAWSIPLFSGSFDKLLASCILHNIFTDQAWVSRAVEHFQSTSSKKASKRSSAKASRGSSKRESTVIQSPSVEENSTCDPDFLIACAFYVLANRDEQSVELLRTASQGIHFLGSKISRDIYGPICKALQSALGTEEPFDLPSSITELLTLIAGSTRMCHVFIAQFISKALICCIDQCEEGNNPVEMLTDIAMFISNASSESSPTTMVLFGHALEKSVLTLLGRLSYADRIGMLLLPSHNDCADSLISTFCEQSSLSPDFLQTSISSSRMANPIKSSLINLAESCYVGMVSIADAIADKEVSAYEIPLQQARLYAVLAVLGTVPEFVSVSHDISSLAFILLGGCDCTSIPEDLATIYKDLATSSFEYLLPIPLSVATELRRLASDYVSRAPLAVAYVSDYISTFPIEFLESLTRRRHLIDDPGALLSILIAQIAGEDIQINPESRREVLILRLVLRMMSFSSPDRSVDNYQEKNVYGEFADENQETPEGDDDSRTLSLLKSLEAFDQMSCIVPSQTDAESLSGLCFYHPELLACAQTVTPDRFQTLFITRMVTRLAAESYPSKLPPEKISQVIINLFQLATKIYPETSLFWSTAVTLIKTSVDLTSRELISALDQQRIFLAILSLTEQVHHSSYLLIFILSNIHSKTNNEEAKLTPKVLQDQLIGHFVTRVDMERQLQALYLLCHGVVWSFLKTGVHEQNLENAINALSKTTRCVDLDRKMLESSATMRSLGFSLLFDDLSSSLNFLNGNSSEEERVNSAPEDNPIGKEKGDDEQDDEAIAHEDNFLSTLLIHVMREIWKIRLLDGSEKSLKKKAQSDPALMGALRAVQISIDTMIAYLDTYAFYINTQTEQSVARYAMSSIIGASILRVNDRERGSKLLEKLVANLSVTSLSMACVKLYQNILDGINLQQPCVTLFLLLRQKISGTLEGRRVELEDAKQAILVLYNVFISVIAEDIDKDLKKLILDVLIEFCTRFPTVLDPAAAVTIAKAISSVEFYISLPSLTDGASNILHSSLYALGHLVEACDCSIIPVLKELVPPLLGYLNAQVVRGGISTLMESFDVSLYSETTLAVVTVLSSLVISQGRFMTPYLSEVIIQLCILCPLGPCVGEVFTINSNSASPQDLDIKLDVVRRVFKALLPELPTETRYGITEYALKILTTAVTGLSAISKVVALRLLLPAMQVVLDKYVVLVRKYALQHVEPLVHALALVLYPTLSEAVLTNELRVDVVKFVLSVVAVRADNTCYALLFSQYDRLETCAIYLLAELDLKIQEKSLGGVIEQCWSWCMECINSSLGENNNRDARTIKSNLSLFGSLFEKTCTEAVTSIQLTSPPSVPRMTACAHILAVLGGQDPQRLVAGVGKLLYEIIGTYLFAITSPLGCVSYGLDTKTIAQLIDTRQRAVELPNAPMGMFITCGLDSSASISGVTEDGFYEVYSMGRYFNLFLFACGHVVGILRDDVYIAAISFIVAIVCSAVASCNELKDIAYPSLKVALQAAEGSNNTPMLWEYLHDMSITLTKNSNDALRLRGIELLEVFLCVVLPHDTHWLTRAAGVIDEAIEDLHEGVSTAAQHLIRSVENVTGKLYRDLVSTGV